MYRSIVVGTDGSETANIAVSRALELARLTGATVHLVHAFQPLTKTHVAAASVNAGPAIDVQQINEGMEVAARALLDDISRGTAHAEIDLQVHARPGDPADALIDAAREFRADLLVVGNRGMSGVRRFVLGSVPNKVSHHSPCSLLIVDTSAGEE
jgi:nucleotide-binding universal stress UspA family protein